MVVVAERDDYPVRLAEAGRPVDYEERRPTAATVWTTLRELISYPGPDCEAPRVQLIGRDTTGHGFPAVSHLLADETADSCLGRRGGVQADVSERNSWQSAAIPLSTPGMSAHSSAVPRPPPR